MTFVVNAAIAQKVIKGIVKGAEGSPVPGTTISLKGSTNHAIADCKGEFSLTTYAPFPISLAISSIGFATREVEVTAENYNNVGYAVWQEHHRRRPEHHHP